MKNTIIRILKYGHYNGKKYNIEDVYKKIYFLQNVLEKNKYFPIAIKNNKFWSKENLKNRAELIVDIMSVTRFSFTDTAYFHIVNRFENGDGYGIIKIGD